MAPKQNAEEIFNKAVELSDPAEQAAYLDEACAGDEKLRAQVDALLKWHTEAGDFLEVPAVDPNVTLETSAVTESSGTVIGRYKLLERIGEGGMATVYMAEQKHPIRRRVALKIIKLGMDTKQVIARFEAERQALAMMDHPNIAKVFDAGTTETGRPYFVMELVRGVPITEFCDKNHLNTQERLELFVSVCNAVQHAHQKGIIHRDIKPSNIMVTLHDGKPVVKVIDFGIAKAMNQQLTERTVFTRYSQMIGTPEYMSPEQAEMSGLDIDTRTDVFSLGVLLYELLTGTTPFDSEYLLSKGYGEMQRIIREEEPVRPSTKVSTLGETLTDVAKHRRTSPELLCKLIRSDLDWIVMKTLEKDRQRRYESISELAADVKRHLDNEPVLAGRPSRLYKIQKFVKRNKVLVTSAAAIVVVVILAAIISVTQAITATRAKDRADQARRAEQQQRVAFEEEAKRATEAEQRESQLRVLAQEQGLAARRRSYAADMLLCRQALADNNLRRARQLLERQRPQPGQEDLRGWEWRYLWRGCQGDELLKWDTEGKRPLKAVFTHDGKSVLTFDVRAKVGLWNLVSQEEQAILQDDWSMNWQAVPNSGHLCISSDGKWVVADSRNTANESVVRIWEVDSHRTIAEWIIGKAPISCVAISPDKKRLAVFCPKQSVSTWDISTGERQSEIPIAPFRNASLGAVCYSPDGDILAIGDQDGSVRLLHTETGAETRIFSADTDEDPAILSLAFSPSGRSLAVGNGFYGPNITIWDLATNTRTASLEGHVGFVAGLTFSPDGDRLASASGDQTIKLWKTSDWSVETTLLGHTDEVWSVDFSRDGERLVSCGKDDYLRVWDISARGRNRGSVDLPPSAIQVDASPDGKTIVVVSEEGDVQLLDAATLEEKVIPRPFDGNNVAAFWGSAHEIFVGSLEPPQIKAWDLTTNKLSTFELGLEGNEPLCEGWPVFEYLPESHVITALVRNRNPESITIMCWDTLARKELSSCTITENTSGIREVTISQDAHRLALVRGASVEVRDLLTGEKVCDFAMPNGAVHGLDFFPDGKWFAAAGTEKPIATVWDVSTQQEVVSLHGHNMIISDIEISPDGRRLATSTIGIEPIKLWDTTSWEEVGNLDGLVGSDLYGTEVLSDGNTIAAWEWDPENHTEHLRLWQALSWAEIEAAELADHAEGQDK